MEALHELRDIMVRHSVATTGQQETAIPRLGIFRADRPTAPTPGFYDPMLCLVVSGRKHGFIRRSTLEFRAGDAFVLTVDLPVVGTVIDAAPERPYLALSLRLHRPTLASVVLASSHDTGPVDTADDGLCIATASPDLLDALVRLARLMDRPDDIAVLAPLIEQEVVYRLLTGPWRGTLAAISQANGRTAQISRAVAWLRDNPARGFHAATLADVAAMSVPTLNRHFRAVTAMSPLEYHKQIRLQEARRLLLLGEDDVATIGEAVGYRSVSQFTREYRRLFGEPPGRDVERIRRERRGDGPSA